MKKAGPKVAARQGGGFRPGFGNFNEEHLEQQSSSAAVQQKQLAQQGTNSDQSQTGGSALQPGNSQQTPAQQVKTDPPREVSDFKDELIKRPTKDIVQGLKSIFDVNDLLGIKPGDTPEEQEHKKQVNQRFQKLTEEQQEVAKKRYQQEMEKKKHEEEEKEQQKMEEEKEKESSIAAPSSPRKGPVGPAGSKKQRAKQQLEQQRQSIGQVAGAN